MAGKVSSIATRDGRLPPPSDLTEAEREHWIAAVNSRPGNWFSPSHIPTLKQLCRHAVTADLVDAQLKAFDPKWLRDDEGLKRYDKLLAMQERESRAMTALMRSMRLTQQSLVRAEKVIPGDSGDGRKPWQRD